MKARDAASLLILALRIGLALWLLLATLSAVLGVTADILLRMDEMYATLVALIFSAFVHPWVALCWGMYCGYRQYRAFSGRGALPNPLAVGSERSMDVESTGDQALRTGRSAVEAVFVCSGAVGNETGFAARVHELGDSTALLPGLRQDSISLTVDARGEGRSTLRIDIRPVHVWLYGFLTVDAGRCARRMERLQDAIQRRVDAQSAIVDRRRLVESVKARESEAQLSMLRAQVEPHFIFNTLAHVRVSLECDAQASAALLDALVDFLRRNTSALNRMQSPLGEELDMVERYLGIVSMRMGPRLRCSLHCADRLRAWTVPAACVLVLAENAVKHGIERCADGGEIAILCAESGDELCIEVRNDGPGLASAGGGPGGLSNLRERMRLMYGPARRLEIESPETGGVRVVLRIPATAEPA